VQDEDGEAAGLAARTYLTNNSPLAAKNKPVAAATAAFNNDNNDKNLKTSLLESNQDWLNRLAKASPLNPQPEADKPANPTFAVMLAAQLADAFEVLYSGSTERLELTKTQYDEVMAVIHGLTTSRPPSTCGPLTRNTTIKDPRCRRDSNPLDKVLSSIDSNQKRNF
jgi:hypothetical protein